ncbi:MAG: ATP-binding protein [Bacteroidota bacterium]
MSLRILYLEDNLVDAQLIQHVLSAEGILADYTIVSNKREFEAAIQDFVYDLVLADYELLDYTALEAILTLRENVINVPILLVSGAIDGESAVGLLQAGATDYILKDHLARLAPALERALESYEQQKQIEANEKEIQSNHTILSQAEELAKLGAFEWELVDNKMTWTPGMALIFEVTPIAFDPTIESVSTLIHPDDLQFLMEKVSILNTSPATLIDKFSETFRLLLPGNVIKHVNSRGEIRYNRQGTPTKIVGVMQDITSQKAKEEEIRQLNEALERKVDERTMELRASERRLRLISDNITDLITVHGPNGEFEYISLSVRDILGYEREEFKPISYENLFHPDDLVRVVTTCLAGFEKGDDVKVAARLLKKNGEFVWMESHIRVKRDHAGNILQYQASTRDITTHKQAEAQMERALQQERELNELRSRFVSMASHQFRTPLTIMLSNVELMEAMLGRVSDERVQLKYRTIVDRLKGEVDHLTHLMGDIMEMGKIDAGKVEAQFEPVNLHALVVDIFKSEYEGQPILDATEFFMEGNPYYVQVDKRLITHALMNLINNAVKYSPACSPPQVHIKYCSKHTYIHIRDFGIGIPEEDKESLFESWFRARNVSEIKGTGLGLAIAKEFVEANQGEISFKSELHKGSTFTIKLPASRNEA